MTESENIVKEFSAICSLKGVTPKTVAENLYNENTKKIKIRKPSFTNQCLGLFKLSYDVGSILKAYIDEEKTKH